MIPRSPEERMELAEGRLIRLVITCDGRTANDRKTMEQASDGRR